MTVLNEIYKCEVCGNIIEVVHAGVGGLICCGKPMKLQKENTVEAAVEKHIPVVEKKGDGILIKIGAVPHPMTEEHYIEWIEVISKNGKVKKKYLKPGDVPEWDICCVSDDDTIRAYCNLHGLWKAD